MGLTGGQKFCLWMVALGTLGLLVGSFAPFWLYNAILVVESNYGLWMHCIKSPLTDSTCRLYEWKNLDWDDFTVWFYVVHGTAGLASLFAVGVLFVCLVKICGNSTSARDVAGFAFFGGLMAITAAVVFYLKKSESILVAALPGVNMDWAFIAFSAGSGVVTFFSLILLCLPNEHNEVRPF